MHTKFESENMKGRDHFLETYAQMGR